MALGWLFTIAANYTDPGVYFLGDGVVESTPAFRDWFMSKVREHTVLCEEQTRLPHSPLYRTGQATFGTDSGHSNKRRASRRGCKHACERRRSCFRGLRLNCRPSGLATFATHTQTALSLVLKVEDLAVPHLVLSGSDRPQHRTGSFAGR